MSDDEPSVREAARQSRTANRQRRWADDYLKRVEEASEALDFPVGVFPSGAALERIGDDSHLRRLNGTNLNTMSPQVRFWRNQITEGLEKNWRERTRKWEDLGEGAISETTQGHLVQKDAEVEVWLRLNPGTGVRPISRWGGRLRAKDESQNSDISIGEAHITLTGGRNGNILIGNVNTTSGSESELWASFSGRGRLELEEAV